MDEINGNGIMETPGDALTADIVEGEMVEAAEENADGSSEE
jgi:hypothetical protein